MINKNEKGIVKATPELLQEMESLQIQGGNAPNDIPMGDNFCGCTQVFSCLVHRNCG